ncbi:MAG: immune inhibitor A [Thermoproteota archaeon]|nr:immune inhibitor A [Thermoproteota archaeon]
MKEKIISVSIALVLVLSVLGVAFVPTASSSIELPDYEPIDIGPKFREKNLPIDGSSIPENIKPIEHNPTPYYEVGNISWWLALDDYMGYYFFTAYELRAIGDTAEIWVQVDLSWPEGDPRAYPTILDEQIEYLLEKFETNIYPIDTSYFGVPDAHCGDYPLLEAWGYMPPGYYNGSCRNVILVSNVRDENYYDYEYPYYIAGFYSSSFEAYFDRNIISIDTWQWERRIGPEGYEWIPETPVTRPYLYESTIAHEYQHLIHADYNPGDATFMNEGCSMYAEILCGYPPSWSHINSYLYTPDNSLTEWGDQGDINILADYGAATLWTVYLSDHYGGATFISHFVQAGIPGIEGINAALEYFGYKERFDDVYRDWRIANLIHTDFPGCGKYNYETFDLGGEEVIPIFTHEISGLPVHPTKGTDFGTTITILDYDTGVAKVGPYGSDYIMLNEWNRIGKIFFDGDDIAIYGWTMTPDGWYSGATNLMDALLIGEAYVDPVDPTLELTTYWDIEDYWDFGFIQVSTDGGETWISLENEYTTYDHDPSAHPDIVANLPGLTSWSGFITPDGWVTMEFDLKAYEGQTVLVGFRYMTDWATLYEGWYISEASVSGEPLTLTPVYPEADFMVTAVYAFVIDGYTFYVPMDMWLWDKTEWGTTFGFEKPSYTILIVSSITEKGFVDYEFSANRLRGRFWHNIDEWK